MTGSKKTMRSFDELHALREHGESQTDWGRLRREQAEGIEPAADEDSPDATVALREAVAKRPVGRPVGSANKEQVAIRFDREVLAAFRSSGPGWQTRINEVLKDWLNSHPVG
jgi:uncharacterized protein (DUF4415 family)